MEEDKNSHVGKNRAQTMGHEAVMKELARRTGKPFKAVKELYDTYAEIIKEAVERGDRVVMGGIGTLKVLPTPARVGRDVVRDLPIDIPAGKRIKMIAHKNLKETI